MKVYTIHTTDGRKYNVLVENKKQEQNFFQDFYLLREKGLLEQIECFNGIHDYKTFNKIINI